MREVHAKMLEIDAWSEVVTCFSEAYETWYSSYLLWSIYINTNKMQTDHVW